MARAFGVQFAGPGTEYQLLHPHGTGLVRPAAPSESPSEESGYAPYDFVDDLDAPALVRACEGEPLSL